ncbi:MAG: hypothetical protein IPL91_11335 [Hyphomicrobium sp.]|nr:hypothetical protein [Hyphomicrobium sp.]
MATLFDFLSSRRCGLEFVDVASRRADVVFANLIFGRLLGASVSRVRPVSAGVRANALRELKRFANSSIPQRSRHLAMCRFWIFFL